MTPAGGPEDLLARANEARRRGDAGEARRLLEMLVARQPGHAAALNSLGLIALGAGDSRGAIGYFERATAADPAAPPLWLNLAQAQRSAGDVPGEIASLDRALAIDPHLLPAVLQKAQALERVSRVPESADIYRALLAATEDSSSLPQAVRQALDHGREIVRAEDTRRSDTFEDRLAAVYTTHADADLRRVQGYVDQKFGRRRVYQQQPVDGHFPYLPAIEFFDRTCFPWFESLEAATPEIRRELVSLWDESDDDFRPYVAFAPTEPVNQWTELNHSPRWSAWFLWKDGVKQEAHCARCPATTHALEAVPLMDHPGKAPTVMFSILEPRTRIPPHTGSSNVRTTVHLPLVVPDGCGFRVGAETREWREGEAWAFDDTIEHEAWNDSDRPRAILILDVWNPLLTEAERAVVRVVG
ncbi:aspartyl/asparaginyl beta-hydroxylase domain-containing protein [Sphingosinicella sp. LHD-64]|uniref:aspartyl/asparaginyl beta-hydroxylase domain-containing protein n=1 Tax=Sphingosinicella sp. LHD-64 TaxID=3072139 RepID=UPI00280D723E|nr:aspartyl/asparaginyl beta-hydroxylase domain-containing protein [Sphingosinicella sp. LHD-64]MDQ8756478.1 aspartyl/asparaginyl beta-hydroxylase domain-containing protein [Sphingosinicella sp. LHD-64]